ncbi:DUF1109 domain-containing protein [Rhodoferax sp.]|uniref:DUF1109 domain-containing protein n=1 Tax=Rhodoferax sp. TaxID=50421 RepID=UPI00276A9230|nr:DUF1109 domain-containing protein [Rhodoferax sp.]
MKTDDLIAMLATGVAPVDPGLAQKRFQNGLLFGGLGAAALMLTLFGLNPNLPMVAMLPMFWVKLVFPASLAAIALLLAQRLSHPGVPMGWAPAALLGPIVLLAVLATSVWLQAAAQDRSALLLGQTWKTCALSIALVSAPVFVAVMWAMKGLAPTRLRLAGAAAGLLASTVGTLVYALHCPEMAAPFLLVWYGLGMAIPVAVGALLGPRLLHW